MPQNLILTTDGSSKFRHMRGGYVVRNADSGSIIETGSKNFGYGTSNVAEYLALLEGCRVLGRYQPAKVVIYTDSQLIVRQLKGEYRIRDGRLRRLHAAAVDKLRALRAKIIWHRRDEGDGPLADALAGGRSQEEPDGTDDQLDQGRHRAEAQGGAGDERLPPDRSPGGGGGVGGGGQEAQA